MNGLLMLITATNLAAGQPDVESRDAKPNDKKLLAESFSVRYLDSNQTARFEVVFNRPPDFFTLSPDGAQSDSFQFHIDTMDGNNGMNGSSPYPWETIVRGEEIHVRSDVRVRDHIQGPSPDPGSGGWGPIAGSVPYTLSGATLTFTIRYPVLNTGSGKFPFTLELYRFGEWTGVTYEGTSEPRNQRSGRP